MNAVFKRCSWLAAGAVLCLILAPAGTADRTGAQDVPPADSGGIVPGRPPASPVDRFRKLLQMDEAELGRALTNYPPATRERIIEKVQEYKLAPPDFRELRLQVTELRWCLLPLMKATAAGRAARLKLVPESYRELVAARLAEWDLMPPALKDEVLEYETTMHYFVGRDAVVQRQMVIEDLPEKDRRGLEQALARWQALPEPERLQMYASFLHFFELNEEEQQKTLKSLSEPERQETEKVLDPIEKWPRWQQQHYLAAFRQFANMSPEERRRFMKNAERWQKMPPEERQAWRDLVQQLSEMPPMPPGLALPRPQPAGPVPAAVQNPQQKLH